MLREIIEQNEKRISEDIKDINGIIKIDFMDIFPISEEHRKQLDNEVSKISKLIDSTEKGNFYLLNNPINTKWGELGFIKIRFFDESKLNYEAAPDFKIKDWNELKQRSQQDKRLKYIERPEWKAIEYKTENCLAYFLNPLVTEVYHIKSINNGNLNR